MGNQTSSTLTLSTGAPQGCVLSPLLYSLYTSDCMATHGSSKLVKFADNTVVVGLITNNDEKAYLEEVNILSTWCRNNNLSLNITKTKEMIVDYGKKQVRNYSPLLIKGATVERVRNFKYLGVHLTEDLSWTTHINSLVTRAHQRIYHLRRLARFRVSHRVLKAFYTGAVESLLSGSITTWLGVTTAKDRNVLSRMFQHFIPKSSLERAPGNWLNCHLSESECDCDGIIFHLFTSSVLLLGVTTDSHVPPFLEES
ncbi:hypothetical protein PGIGA_G00204120 [Pangasianodon gigas]|uniref:Uncharacterized protein n=1 Tax=Pangasianodon gigas TaxID=30993 RepID=A0ACC5WFS7_PANGG|nr:hypothetical protein [Pangasianodon gigas]